MIPKLKHSRYIHLLIIALLSLYGCMSSPELISEISVEDKIARLRIG